MNLILQIIIAYIVIIGAVLYICTKLNWITWEQATPITIDSVAQQIIADMTDGDIEAVKAIPHPDGMVKFHSTAGRAVRNHYNLWSPKCPLTKQWHDDRKAGLDNFMVDGIDHHPQHPDAISGTILKRVWQRVHHVDPF